MEKYEKPVMEVVEIEEEMKTFGPIVTPPCHSKNDDFSGTNP